MGFKWNSPLLKYMFTLPLQFHTYADEIQLNLSCTDNITETPTICSFSIKHYQNTNMHFPLTRCYKIAPTTSSHIIIISFGLDTRLLQTYLQHYHTIHTYFPYSTIALRSSPRPRCLHF